MPDRVNIHWDNKKEGWKAYVFDGDSHDGYGKHLVHVYDEPPDIVRLAFVAHFNEIMGLMYSGFEKGNEDNPDYKRALHNLVMKSMRECCKELQARFDEEHDRQLEETPRLGETKEDVALRLADNNNTNIRSK